MLAPQAMSCKTPETLIEQSLNPARIFRIIGFALDTAPRKNTSEVVSFSRLIRICNFVLETPARQTPNKFGFALASSYL